MPTLKFRINQKCAASVKQRKMGMKKSFIFLMATIFLTSNKPAPSIGTEHFNFK